MAKVLVIEDHAATREYMSFLLRHQGHTVLEADDGARGLELARAEHPALIISDILMPTMDGIELARRLHADRDLASIPLIFCTATYRKSEAERAALSVGARAVLLKPVKPDALMSTVAELLGSSPPTAIDEPVHEPRSIDLTDKLARATSSLDLSGQRLVLLIQAGREFLSAEDVRALGRELARAARSMVSARFAVAWLDDPAEARSSTCSTAGLPDPSIIVVGGAPRALLARLGRDRAAMRVERVSTPSDIGLPPGHPPIGNALIARIGTPDAPIGLVYAVDKVGGAPFEEQEELLLSTLADQVATLREKMRVDLELERSEERHRTVSEIATDFAYSYHVEPDGRLTLDWLTPLVTRMLGYTREELDQDRWHQIVHPDDLPKAIGALRSVLEGHESEIEVRVYTKAGHLRTLVDYKRPFGRGPDGRVNSFVGAAKDVTETRLLEEQLRQAQKMEAVGRLAGGIAHDFNNMLTVITGYAGMVLDHLKQGDPLREDVHEIITAGERAASLTRQLLAFSRRQVLQPRVLEVNTVVADMDRMLRRLIGENIDLETGLSPDAGVVRVDPSQVEQVLMNLAINARDAMSERGKLTIETLGVELDAEYCALHPGVRSGRYVLIAVSDTGCGMDRATQARIFEPFFTTKKKGEGTGLGLSTVYGIVQQSGGHVWVYSEPGRGTTFKIYLPQTSGPADVLPREAEADTPRIARETVLLVEDEPAVRRLSVKVLRDQGYTVLEADTPDRALEISTAHPTPIHLVVSDVVMPGCSGPDLFARLRERWPLLRALFVSGYTESAVVRQGVLEPGTPFLAKPFSPTALSRRVREVLEGARS